MLSAWSTFFSYIFFLLQDTAPQKCVRAKYTRSAFSAKQASSHSRSTQHAARSTRNMRKGAGTRCRCFWAVFLSASFLVLSSAWIFFNSCHHHARHAQHCGTARLCHCP